MFGESGEVVSFLPRLDIPSPLFICGENNGGETSRSTKQLNSLQAFLPIILSTEERMHLTVNTELTGSEKGTAMFRTFRIRPLTTYEESILKQAREIRADRRREVAKIIFERLGSLLAIMLIAAAIAGLLDLINKVEWPWVPTWWALAATFAAMVMFGLAAGLPEEPEFVPNPELWQES